MTQLNDIIITIKEASLALENYEKMFQTVDENFKKSFVEAVNFICENEFFREARRKQIIEVGLKALKEFDDYFQDKPLVNVQNKINYIFETEKFHEKIKLVNSAADAFENYEDLIEPLDDKVSEEFYKNVNYVYKNEFNPSADRKEVLEKADSALKIFKETFKDNKYIKITENYIEFSEKDENVKNEIQKCGYRENVYKIAKMKLRMEDYADDNKDESIFDEEVLKEYDEYKKIQNSLTDEEKEKQTDLIIQHFYDTFKKYGEKHFIIDEDGDVKYIWKNIKKKEKNNKIFVDKTVYRI